MPGIDAFVGRTVELAVLAEELDRVRAGEPRVVWVSGRAGIGKTSLLRRFLAAAGATALWASGDEIEASLSFGVIAQLVAGLPAPLVRPGSLLAAGPPVDADPLAVGVELLGVLSGLQASGPVALVVDDVQWVDDPSAQALVFVVRRLRRDHVLVVLSGRSDAAAGSAPWGRVLAQGHLVRTLALDGLSASDMIDLSAAVDGPALTPAAGRRLQEHTGGHPMHARALLEELSPEALAEPSGMLPAPRSLASLVLVRVAKLSAPALELVLAAAVLGTRSALADVVALAAVPDPLGALDDAVGAGLLEEVPAGAGHDVVFPHPLVRAAIYADLPPVRLHSLHRAAADLLGGARSMSHRVAAAVGPDPDLAAELETLGRAAVRDRHWRAAADHLLAAADLSPTAEMRSRRLIDAAAAMMSGGDIVRAWRVEADVRAAAPSASRSRVLGQLAALTGRFAVAREELTAVVDSGGVDGGSYGADGGEDRSMAAAHLGLVSLIQGEPARAVDLADRALQTAAEPDVASMAHYVRVIGLAAQGRRDDAARVLAQPRGGDRVRHAGVAAERSALRGMLALWSGDPVDAADALSSVVRDDARGVPMQGRVIILGHLAEAHYRLGDWDASAASSELAISLAQDAGILLGTGIAHAIASYVAAGRGEWDVARARVATATASAEVLPWWASRGYAATARATLAQAAGDHAEMQEALRTFTDPTVRRLVDGIGALPWRVLHVESLLELGRIPEADDALAELESRAAGRPLGWPALEVARLRARREELRSDPVAVHAAYGRGMDYAGTVRATFSRARLETAYGRYLLESGERRPAVDLLRAARGRFAQLGATPFLVRCDDLLRAAGLHPPPAGDPLGLTPQEIAVARSVARGRTNQETGAELFVTSRTVAFHLSNIYAKLGISSRRELAAHLSELPVRSGVS